MMSSVRTLRPISWFAIARMTPIGIVYMNAKYGEEARQLGNNPDGVSRNAQMVRARTKAQTGNCVSQTSMAMTPDTNMDTVKGVSTRKL